MIKENFLEASQGETFQTLNLPMVVMLLGEYTWKVISSMVRNGLAIAENDYYMYACMMCFQFLMGST